MNLYQSMPERVFRAQHLHCTLIHIREDECREGDCERLGGLVDVTSSLLEKLF